MVFWTKPGRGISPLLTKRSPPASPLIHHCCTNRRILSHGSKHLTCLLDRHSAANEFTRLQRAGLHHTEHRGVPVRLHSNRPNQLELFDHQQIHWEGYFPFLFLRGQPDLQMTATGTQTQDGVTTSHCLSQCVD